MSNKQKQKKLKLNRMERSEKKALVALEAGVKNGTIIPVDKTKIFSRSVIPSIPDYYRDTWFKCKDCGDKDLWTAKQQERWYEEQGGEIEAVAIRCRSCRGKEKLRKEEARRIHLAGLQRREADQAEQDVDPNA